MKIDKYLPIVIMHLLISINHIDHFIRIYLSPCALLFIFFDIELWVSVCELVKKQNPTEISKV